MKVENKNLRVFMIQPLFRNFHFEQSLYEISQLLNCHGNYNKVVTYFSVGIVKPGSNREMW